MIYFPWSQPDICANNAMSCEKLLCIPAVFKTVAEGKDFLPRSWITYKGQFYDHRASPAVLEKYKFGSLPSRSLIQRINNILGKNLSEELSNEQLEQYNQYKFLAGIVAFMGELRWEAEKDSRENRDQLYWRLDYDLPLQWTKICHNFKASEKDPPMELIAQIAISYGPKMLELAQAPRKILRQHLRKEHLSRVQQIDNRCMIWLTRQPGSSTVQKAGSRQQILAVVRHEHHDTLENRVLKNMLELCGSYANDYCYRYRKYNDSDRLKQIRLFALEIDNILHNNIFAQIGPLFRMPKPNYVLRFDRYYKEMWYWYQRLVKQQEETEIAWQWQHRLFADWCHLAVTAAALNIGAEFFDHRLWFRSIAKNSCWFSSTDWPSPILINGKIMEILLPDMSEAPDFAGKLGADMLISVVNPGEAERKWLLIWSIHVFAPGDNSVTKLFKKHIGTSLREISGATKKTIAGLVISSNYSSGSEISSDFEIESGMMTASLVVNGQHQNMADRTVSELKKILDGFIKL